MAGHDRIETNPGILGGKPVIRGTRISVQFVLEMLSSGMSFDEIVHDYPELTKEDLQVAVRYASAFMGRVEGAEYGVV